jgi:hypothetical protein
MRHPSRLPIFPANAPSKPARLEVLHRRLVDVPLSNAPLSRSSAASRSELRFLVPDGKLDLEGSAMDALGAHTDTLKADVERLEALLVATQARAEAVEGRVERGAPRPIGDPPLGVSFIGNVLHLLGFAP